jgi:hypothetical protein
MHTQLEARQTYLHAVRGTYRVMSTLGSDTYYVTLPLMSNVIQ